MALTVTLVVPPQLTVAAPFELAVSIDAFGAVVEAEAPADTIVLPGSEQSVVLYLVVASNKWPEPDVFIVIPSAAQPHVAVLVMRKRPILRGVVPISAPGHVLPILADWFTTRGVAEYVKPQVLPKFASSSDELST